MAQQADTVPLIDISPFVDEAAHDDESRARVAERWDTAMTEVGFALITGHGVAPEVITGLRDGAMAFFAQEASAKLAHSFGPYGTPLGGYTAMGTEAVARTRDEHGSDGGTDTTKVKAAAADLVESFMFKPESPNAQPACLAHVGNTYHAELLRVLGCLHHLTAAALGLPREFFEPFFTPSARVSLRLAYYPPIPPQDQSSSAVLRYGEHTDYTGYTLLHQDETDLGNLNAGGLQVLLQSGEWQAVVPQTGAFVVNIGDLYEVWTNGRWRSTVHRVMTPLAGSAAAAAPRLSIPFFTGPHDDALIDAIPTCVDAEHPAKYKPVKALDHLRRKLKVSNV